MKPESSAIAAFLVLAFAAAACTPQPRQSYLPASQTASAPDQSASAGATAPPAGKQVYQEACAGCHQSMTPKLGDKEVLKKNEEQLVASTVKGKGGMPPKGGKPNLSEGDIRAAVQYMIAEAKK